MGIAVTTAPNIRGLARCSRLALTASLIGGALFVLTPELHAQEIWSTPQPPRHRPPGAVRVLVATDEPELLLTVAPPGCRRMPNALESESACPGQLPIVSCYRHCELWAFPGYYVLRATNAEDHLDYEFPVHVEQDSVFQVRSGSRVERVVGMATGIAGPIAVLVGAILVLDAAGKSGCDACTPDAMEVSGGLALGLFGLLATPIGWIMFANSAPHADLEDEDSAAREPPVRVGVQALPHGGWGLGLSTRF